MGNSTWIGRFGWVRENGSLSGEYGSENGPELIGKSGPVFKKLLSHLLHI